MKAIDPNSAIVFKTANSSEVVLRRQSPQRGRGMRKRIARFTRRFSCFLLPALLVATSVGAESPSPLGVWLHPNGRIRVGIAPCGDRLCGTLIWFKWPNDAQGLPLVDLKNPDPALRFRPLLGLTILRDLRPTSDHTWDDGKIYNPDDGADYAVSMSYQDNNTMSVRAYVLLPLFGETQIWTRVQ